MKTKYVCRGLISMYVNFHNNRTMQSTNLHIKFCRWGEKETEPGVGNWKRAGKLFFLFTPTSHEHEFYGVMGSFTRLVMKTKYVCHELICPYVNFHNNRTK